METAGNHITAAFVSTNSICQGESVPAFWKQLVVDHKAEIQFAYSTFIWDSEASSKAHVHGILLLLIGQGRFPRNIVTPGSVDVQLVREYRQIRARDAKARPVPGAYVKVYARCGATGETRFHKDGYTDLRGAFDYASVSTDSDSRPSEYAIFVDAPGLGVKILRVGGDGK